jgi:hypothetical protein
MTFPAPKQAILAKKRECNQKHQRRLVNRRTDYFHPFPALLLMKPTQQFLKFNPALSVGVNDGNTGHCRETLNAQYAEKSL